MSWRAGRCLPLSSRLAPGKGPAGRLLGFGGTVKRGRGEGTEPGAAPETCPSEESQAAARSAQPRRCCLALSGTSAPGLPRRGPGRAASQRGTGPAAASHGVGAGPCLALTHGAGLQGVSGARTLTPGAGRCRQGAPSPGLQPQQEQRSPQRRQALTQPHEANAVGARGKPPAPGQQTMRRLFQDKQLLTAAALTALGPARGELQEGRGTEEVGGRAAGAPQPGSSPPLPL